MVRLDDDELNITPEISRALGYQPADQPRPRRTPPAHHPVAPRARREGSFLPPFITLIAIMCVVCLVAAGTAHQQVATQSSQPQVSNQSVPVVGKQEPQSDDKQAGTAEPAPGVASPAAQAPVQRVDVQPARVQYAVHAQVHKYRPQNSGVEVKQRNEIPEYLPAVYDTGRVTAPLFLVRAMPRGGAVDFLGYVSPGTYLLYERLNTNGWRRVVSLDGRYAGYAEVYPTVAYQPRPMRPELLEAIAMIRRIP